MNTLARQEYLQDITRRLVCFTVVILTVLALGLYVFVKLSEENQHSYLVLLVFGCGLLGGFVSIQQRLPGISLNELKVLSSSWVSITLIPINGGIFAIVLMVMFIGHIIQGQLFPVYPRGIEVTDAASFFEWLTNAYPATGTDVAKLFFWSFVAGFSERFVPQIIRKTTDDVEHTGKSIPEK